MPVIATWLRGSDRPYYAEAFASFPDMVLRDGKREAVDMEAVDGLLLTGGEDVSLPWLRQPVPDPSFIQEPDAVRDAWEFAALARALERRLPILGICRGHQVLNVALGGTLFLDIPGHNRTEQRDGNIQPLRYEPGAEPLFRCEAVNSSHHQALDALGEGLRVEARCAEDGVVEQVRGKQTPFIVGVQYHPERHALYGGLFGAFAGAVRDFCGGKAR